MLKTLSRIASYLLSYTFKIVAMILSPLSDLGDKTSKGVYSYC